MSFVVQLDEDVQVIWGAIEDVIEALRLADGQKDLEIVVYGSSVRPPTTTAKHTALYAFLTLADLTMAIGTIQLVNVPSNFTNTLSQRLRNSGWNGTIMESTSPEIDLRSYGATT